jgi:ABC-type phosphate transport system substrate-binding protein
LIPVKKILALMALAQLFISVAYADPEVVVIVNPAAAKLTKEQVADLFLGKVNIYKPLDLPNTTPVKAEFYQKVSGHDLSQVKATWSRLLFTGKAQPPKELPDAAAVKKAVAADPKAVGYIAKSDVDSSVKVILELQ